MQSGRLKSYPFIRVAGLMLVMVLLGQSCNKLQQLPFLGKENKEFPRAFYVDKNNRDRVERTSVKISGNLKEAVGLVEDSIEEVADTTSNVLRIKADSSQMTNRARPIMKVTTPYIRVDSLDEFEKYFTIGDYILDDPSLSVKPDNKSYRVEALVILRGRDFVIDFNLVSSVNWNLYKTGKGGEEIKIDESREKMYGVSQYRYRDSYTYIDRNGREKTAYQWKEVNIQDQPKTKGVIERRLVNQTIELAALNDLTATVVSNR